MKSGIFYASAFLFCFLMVTDAKALNQSALDRLITLEVKNTDIKHVLSIIERLADVRFAYSPENIANNEVSLNARQETVGSVLRAILSNQGVTFEAVNERLVILRRTRLFIASITINGIITDTEGKPLEGVVIAVNGSERRAETNARGEFALVEPNNDSTLSFYLPGFRKQEISINKRDFLLLSLVMRQNLSDMFVR